MQNSDTQVFIYPFSEMSSLMAYGQRFTSEKTPYESSIWDFLSLFSYLLQIVSILLMGSMDSLDDSYFSNILPMDLLPTHNDFLSSQHSVLL